MNYTESKPIWNDRNVPEYRVWDENNIKGFFGEYRYLSNFFPAPLLYRGLHFPSSEHAFMYAKLATDPDWQEYNHIVKLTCAKVKQWGRNVKLRPDWEQAKRLVMLHVVECKFHQNPAIAKLLKKTGDKYLEETNHWDDKIWGVDSTTGEGENALGKILMEVRTQL